MKSEFFVSLKKALEYGRHTGVLYTVQVAYSILLTCALYDMHPISVSLYCNKLPVDPRCLASFNSWIIIFI